jgi:predicted enzyme related to lactoylglutathione lyase
LDPYFGAESAQDTAQEAERNEGRIPTAPAVGPIGHTTLLVDPQDATFAVLERKVTSSNREGA